MRPQNARRKTSAVTDGRNEQRHAGGGDLLDEPGAGDEREQRLEPAEGAQRVNAHGLANADDLVQIPEHGHEHEHGRKHDPTDDRAVVRGPFGAFSTVIAPPVSAARLRAEASACVYPTRYAGVACSDAAEVVCEVIEMGPARAPPRRVPRPTRSVAVTAAYVPARSCEALHDRRSNSASALCCSARSLRRSAAAL